METVKAQPTLARAVRYQLVFAGRLCECGSPDCIVRGYEGRYMAASFDIGSDHRVTWWLSNN